MIVRLLAAALACAVAVPVAAQTPAPTPAAQQDPQKPQDPQLGSEDDKVKAKALELLNAADWLTVEQKQERAGFKPQPVPPPPPQVLKFEGQPFVVKVDVPQPIVNVTIPPASPTSKIIHRNGKGEMTGIEEVVQ